GATATSDAGSRRLTLKSGGKRSGMGCPEEIEGDDHGASAWTAVDRGGGRPALSTQNQEISPRLPGTQRHMAPAGRKITRAQPLDHRRTDRLMNSVDEGILGRVMLERSVDHTTQPISQRNLDRIGCTCCIP